MNDSTRNGTVSWLWQAFALLSILFYAGAFIPSIRFARGTTFYPGDVDPLSTAVHLTLLVVLFFFVISHWRIVLPVLLPAGLFAAFVVLCALSAFWSPLPDATLRGTVALAGCILFGVSILAVFGLNRCVLLIGRAIAFAAAASLVAYYLVPAVGVDEKEFGGAMRGVFAQKNALGTNLLLGFACYVYAFIKGERRTALLPLGLITACFIASRSVSTLSIALLVALASPLLSSSIRGARRFVWRYTAFSLAAIGGVMCLAFPEAFFDLVGRDATLTGRTQIWALSYKFVVERPWFGWGYAGFWNQALVGTRYVHEYVRWATPNSHSGYLEVMLQLGVVGAGIVVCIFLRAFWLLSAAARRVSLPESPWIALVFLILILVNVSESRLMNPGLPTLVLVLGAVALERSASRSSAAPKSSRLSMRPQSAPLGAGFLLDRPGHG